MDNACVLMTSQLNMWRHAANEDTVIIPFEFLKHAVCTCCSRTQAINNRPTNNTSRGTVVGGSYRFYLYSSNALVRIKRRKFVQMLAGSQLYALITRQLNLLRRVGDTAVNCHTSVCLELCRLLYAGEYAAKTIRRQWITRGALLSWRRRFHMVAERK